MSGRFALMMEAASTSETSVSFYRTTRRNNPEDSNIHTRRRENLKSRLTEVFVFFIFCEGECWVSTLKKDRTISFQVLT
jgi:hypothetical protein